MQWGFLLLALIGIFATTVSLHIHKKNGRLKFLGMFWASGLFVAVNLAVIVQPYISDATITFALSQVREWGVVYGLSLVLSSLLLFVRESKPEFSRFPISYVSFPVLIVFSYLLVYNTVILKDWLISIYQAGVIMVSLLIYGVYSYREQIYITSFSGSILLLISYISYNFIPESYYLVWQFFLAAGIGVIFSGYLVVQRHFEEVES